MYRVSTSDRDIAILVKEGNTAESLSQRLADQGVLRYPWIFRQYLRLKGIDRKIHVGSFFVHEPITIARIAAALTEKDTNERTITVLPGWDIRDVGDYFIREKMTTDGEWYHAVGGRPAQMDTDLDRGCREWLNIFLRSNIPACVSSVEGYLAPDTYRVYADATADDIVDTLVAERERQFTPEIVNDIKKQGRTIHEILTMASILEKEVQTKEDKAIVADIFWRRLQKGWALQADSTVHYAIGGSGGTIFTSAKDRAVDSLWNTYKYPGLPPGPISNPGMESILAAIRPVKNDYWYFLTTPDGEVKYARTIEEQTENRARFL